jgi:hypothetical protein
MWLILPYFLISRHIQPQIKRMVVSICLLYHFRNESLWKVLCGHISSDRNSVTAGAFDFLHNSLGLGYMRTMISNSDAVEN